MWLRPFRLDDAASVIMLNTKLVSPVYFIFSMSSYRAKIHSHSRSCVYKYQTHPQSQSQTHRTPKSEYHRRTQPNKTENLQHAGHFGRIIVAVSCRRRQRLPRITEPRIQSPHLEPRYRTQRRWIVKKQFPNRKRNQTRINWILEAWPRRTRSGVPGSCGLRGPRRPDHPNRLHRR